MLSRLVALFVLVHIVCLVSATCIFDFTGGGGGGGGGGGSAKKVIFHVPEQQNDCNKCRNPGATRLVPINKRFLLIVVDLCAAEGADYTHYKSWDTVQQALEPDVLELYLPAARARRETTTRANETAAAANVDCKTDRDCPAKNKCDVKLQKCCECRRVL
ncbi:hypothetical protein TKK_0006958 [Trichogramma kaykai]